MLTRARQTLFILGLMPVVILVLITLAIATEFRFDCGTNDSPAMNGYPRLIAVHNISQGLWLAGWLADVRETT